MTPVIRRKPVPTPKPAPRQIEDGPSNNEISTAAAGEDLWQKAVSAVDEDVRFMISNSPVDPDNKRLAIDIVARESRERRKQCLKQRWKIKKRNGQVIILRDVFEKIIKWVDRFKVMGDLAVSMAPPGYASVPWGAVCLLLKVAIDENEGFAAMIEGVEKVTRMISRYTIFEMVYLQSLSAASASLKSALVTLYASILDFLGKACHFFGQGTTKRFFKAVGESTTAAIEDLLKVIETSEREVERSAQIVGMELLHQTSESVHSINSITEMVSRQMALLNENFNRNQDQRFNKSQKEAIQNAAVATLDDTTTHRIFEPLSRIDDHLQAGARLQVFDWLSSFRYRIPHQTESHGRLPDSGKWMFDTSEYRSWLSSSVSSTLWLHGMPGCGKTKLASAVVDMYLQDAEVSLPQQTIQVAGQTAFAFFYCSRNKAESDRSNPDDILRSIARQLCGDSTQSPVNASLLEVFKNMDRPRPGEYRLPMQHTVDLILQLLASNPAIIVIDALDECDGDKRFALFEALDHIVRDSVNVVKVFLTSRNDGDIVYRLASTPNIYIDARRTKDDLERFVHKEIQAAISERRLLNGRISDQLRDQVIRVLKSDACGMFRWVSLQVQNLCDPRRMKIEADVVRELGKLPKSLSELYSIAFSQILDLGPGSLKLALNALRLLLSAVRPLDWGEFQGLVSIRLYGPGSQASKEEILDVACNFLEDDAAEDRPRIVHTSGREYLESRPEFSSEHANAAAASLCLDVIQCSSPERIYAQEYPYLYLAHHLNATTVESRSPVDLSLMLEQHSTVFGNWRARVDGWLRVFLDPSTRLTGDSQTVPIETVISHNPLFLVCALGLAEYMPLVRPNQSQVQQTLPGQTSVAWSELHAERNRLIGKNCVEIAIMKDRISIVQWLLEMNLVPSQVNDSGDTPLHVVAKHGSSEMVSILLSAGSFDVNEMSTLPQVATELDRTKLPMHEPSSRSHTSMGFRTYDTNGRSGVSSPFYLTHELQTPLQCCLPRNNAVAMVKAFLQHGADVNLRTSSGNTSLQLALSASETAGENCRQLLDAGADPDARLGNHQVVLHRAAAVGHEDVVRQLCHKGARLDMEDEFGRTPYDLALLFGHDRIAPILKPENLPLAEEHVPWRYEDDDDDDAIYAALYAAQETSNTDLPMIVVDDSETLYTAPYQAVPAPHIQVPATNPTESLPDTFHSAMEQPSQPDPPLSKRRSFSSMVKKEWSKVVRGRNE